MRRLLVVLLLLVSARVDAAVVHGTDAEIAVWKQRRTDPAHRSEWQPIQQRADQFVAHPEARWRGNTSSTCFTQRLNSLLSSRTQDAGLRDAAFVYLLTKDARYLAPVREALLAQTRVPGTTFADARRWCPSSALVDGYGDTISPWLRRLAYAYSYVKDALTTQDRQQIERWLHQAGQHLDTVLHNVVAKRVPRRLQNDYTDIRGGGAPHGRTHAGGYPVSPWHEAWQNKGTSMNAAVAVIGTLVGDRTMQQHATRYVQEWLKYGVYPGGQVHDQYRWGKGAATQTLTPQHGYLYSGESLGSVITAVDVLARAGAANLYAYSTSEGHLGTQGGPKSLRLVMRHFAGMTTGAVKEYASDSPTSNPNLLIDPDGPQQRRIEYVVLAQGNRVYQDALIREAVHRRFPSSWNTSGCDMRGGDWCTVPDARFMFADMGDAPDLPGPRPPEPEPPPVVRPPTRPPLRPGCNLDLTWQYPQLLHPQVQYELHVVTLAQGRPTAYDQAVIPMQVDGCPLTITPDGWQAVCTCVCLAEGDYSLSVRARLAEQLSDYSNILDLDVSPQTSCAPPITIPMVPAPPPEQDPAPKPGNVAGPVVGGAVVVGGAAVASGGGSLSIPGLVNRNCVEWAITGVCSCGFPPKPCTHVSYYEPRWIGEVIKKPGTSTLAGLGTILHAAFSATGVPALGGGGAGHASGSGMTNLHYSEVRIWSFPQLLGSPCSGCAPVNALPVLHYASEIDAVPWRTATAAPVPLPGLFPVGVWGNVYPRTGNVIHGSPPIAAALAAVRAMDIVRQPIGLPPHLDAHIVLAPAPALPTCIQMASPRLSGCVPPGVPPPVLETGAVSPNGNYVFLFWVKRECCVEPALATCGLTLPGVSGRGANFCIIPNPPLP